MRAVLISEFGVEPSVLDVPNPEPAAQSGTWWPSAPRCDGCASATA